jgi:hypothetical protein
MSTEKQEVKIRSALLDFVNKEIVITGEPKAVSNRKHELVDILFSLHEQFDKYLHPYKVDNDEDSVFG